MRTHLPVLAGLLFGLAVSGTSGASAADRPIVVRQDGFTITIDIRKDGEAADTTVRKTRKKTVSKRTGKPAAVKHARRPAKDKTVTASRRGKRGADRPVVIAADPSLVSPFAGYQTGFRSTNPYAIPPAWRPTSPDWKLLW